MVDDRPGTRIDGRTAGACLDVDALLEAARTRSGLEDLGGEAVRRRFAQLVARVALLPASLRDPAGAFEMLQTLLVARLRFVADRTRFEGLLEQPVDAPLIVMGLARSGTTLLHALLAEDPQTRAPRYWEVTHPSPPPGLAPPDDPRIEAARTQIEARLASHPDMLRAHPYFDQGPYTLMECEKFWESDTFFRGFLSDDDGERYAYHLELLQHLQWGRPTRRWVLKGTMHQYRLDVLRRTYPDGLFVWIHRDPVRVLASQIRFDAIESRPADGREVADRVAWLRGKLDVALSSPEAEGAGICHVLYQDLVADPVGEVRRIYSHFGLPFAPSYADAVGRWVSEPANRPDRYGSFRYAAEPTGFDGDELDGLFADYRARFGIPRERARA